MLENFLIPIDTLTFMSICFNHSLTCIIVLSFFISTQTSQRKVGVIIAPSLVWGAVSTGQSAASQPANGFWTNPILKSQNAAHKKKCHWRMIGTFRRLARPINVPIGMFAFAYFFVSRILNFDLSIACLSRYFLGHDGKLICHTPDFYGAKKMSDWRSSLVLLRTYLRERIPERRARKDEP